jgi:hypothetical protein
MIQIRKSLKIKKPRVESPGLQLIFYLVKKLKFELKPGRIYGEIFAFLCQLFMGPSVQALEFIRHVDASFYRK